MLDYLFLKKNVIKSNYNNKIKLNFNEKFEVSKYFDKNHKFWLKISVGIRPGRQRAGPFGRPTSAKKMGRADGPIGSPFSWPGRRPVLWAGPIKKN